MKTMASASKPLARRSANAARIAGADFVIPVRNRVRFTDSLLARIRHVKLISQTGPWLSHIDLAAAKNYGIAVGALTVVTLVLQWLGYREADGDAPRPLLRGSYRVLLVGNIALLVIDATTGQNGLTQARQFGEATDVTGVVLTKLDGSAKGGIVFAIETELGIPVKLVGLGETIGDLVPFEPTEFVDALFGDD